MRVYWNADVAARLAVDDLAGFWLDYWHLLHEKDTHPLLSVRPLGLNSILETATLLCAASRENYLGKMKVLATATSKDLKGYRDLGKIFDRTPPLVEPLIYRRNRRGQYFPHSIAPEWCNWVEWATENVVFETLARKLCSSVVLSLRQRHLTRAAFYTRRLASELSDRRGYAARAVVDAANSLLHYGERATEHIEDVLVSILEARNQIRRYSVHFKLAPVPITTRVVNALPQLEIEGVEDSKRLVGLVCEVVASDPFTAGALAEEFLFETLDRLRLRYYVRTHVFGNVDVTDEDGAHSFVSLGEPYWTRRGQHRPIPSFPGDFDNVVKYLAEMGGQAELASRWRAAKWHASRALGDWAEDQHSSASHVWQAIESFLGNTSESALMRLATSYLGIAIEPILKDVAADFSVQKLAIQRSGLESDWYFWNNKKMTVRQWCGRLLSTSSPQNWKKMQSPPVPLLFFDQNVGLVSMLMRKSVSSTTGWMGRRLTDSLYHLYGLRCAAVHEGRRVATPRWAAHLGRIGLELLSTVIHEQACPIRSEAAKRRSADAEST